MESNNEIIKDLKGLVDIVNDGKDGYESSSEATDSIELKGVFLKYSAQRAAFAQELNDHIAKHGGEAEDESGGVLGALHRTWIDIKQALSSREDAAILGAIETGELAAIEKYDQCIFNYASHEDHIELLKGHRFAIAEALREIQTLHEQFQLR
ncbi:MAG: PA2169 family four-helix-bundle protein [Pedobacter sp.]|nr:MAG: PA2169 family four-helix-bundle protein [Pedobacter sp.]